MYASYACRSAEHGIARRQFLGTMVAGAMAGGLSVLTRPGLANQMASDQKRIAVFNLHGGVSQFESFDPKPGANTGGPFLAIPTSVPGVHISELLPMTAKVMHHLTILRGMSTKEDDHGKGLHYVLTGRRQEPGGSHPQLGAVASKALASDKLSAPGNITIIPGGGGSRGNDSAYLGPEYSSLHLGNGGAPSFTSRPEGLSEQSDQSRHELRKSFNEKFLNRRKTAMTQAYTHSFERAREMMNQKGMFDVTQESAMDQERYGSHDLGRHALLMRRLLEHGSTFVQTWHVNYDTHNENFNFHREQIPEFDRAFSCFVEDIADRGMLDSTLIVVLSEFGRTPNINHLAGRDHFSAAWSTVLGGARIPRGTVYGKTNAEGTAVEEGLVDGGNFFHTCLEAVGVTSTGTFEIDGREVPLADPASAPIKELLA